jgi:arylsulfatase A-like enzyme/Flp pilus assembly protein TadD
MARTSRVISRERTRGRRRVASALALALALAACSRERPNVLVVTIDTLRRDAVGWIGGTPDTPALDALAHEAFRFDTTVSPVPLTLPAHTSIMTGLVPRRHGVRDNGQVLPSGIATLAERLRADGYATAAFTSGYPLRALFGLDRGFDRYDDTLPVGSEGWLERPADATTAAAVAWAVQAKRPWFLWVHYYDAHDPYVQHPEFPRTGPRGAYASEVAFVDHAIGTLLEHPAVRGAGTLLTVVTADHGESFGEHGEWTHGFFVYDTTVLVPLVIRYPGRVRAGASPAAARLVDVAPTILDLLGAPPLAGVDGRSLAPVLAGAAVAPVAALVETRQPWTMYGWAPLQALRTDEWKLVDAPRPELYDLVGDPGETRDLASVREDRRTALAGDLARLSAGPATPSAVSDDADVAARLRALGYVASGAATREPPPGLPDPKDRIADRDALLAAETLARQGRFDDAVVAFDRVLAHDPTNPFALLRSGTALLKAGKLAQSIPRLTRAVEADPDQAEAHYALADALTRTGERTRAIDEWRATARLQPRRAAAWANLATVLGMVGRYAEAKDALAHAIAITPDDARLRDNMALLERAAAGPPAR